MFVQRFVVINTLPSSLIWKNSENALNLAYTLECVYLTAKAEKPSFREVSHFILSWKNTHSISSELFSFFLNIFKRFFYASYFQGTCTPYYCLRCCFLNCWLSSCLTYCKLWTRSDTKLYQIILILIIREKTVLSLEICSLGLEC